MLRAIDVMTSPAITIEAHTSVADAIQMLIGNDISALPVVDDDGRLIGILSEADLVQRVEIGTQKVHPWWIEVVTGAATLATEFVKAHGRQVADVMTTDVQAVGEETPLSEIAALFERKRLKRVPVTRDGEVIGVVSRSNLIQALAGAISDDAPSHVADRRIRAILMARLADQPWTHFGSGNVTVANGTVHLWGLVGSLAERTALLALAEEVPGVARVSDEMIPAY